MAYVDPGSGLFIFQSLSSIGVAALFFLRRRIRMLLRRGPTEDPLLQARAQEPEMADAVHTTAPNLKERKAA